MKIQSVQIFNRQKSEINKKCQNQAQSPVVSVQDYRPIYYMPVFGSAAKLNLKYILQKHSEELPESILQKVISFSELDVEKLPTLKDLHDHVYRPLQDATSLDEVKSIYPEFKNVIDLKDYKTNHSKAINDIKKNMPLDGFTLDFLKKLFTPCTMDELVKFYGVRNRSSLTYLAESLGIKKLSKTYLQLYKLSDEAENERFAKKAQSYVRTDKARAKCNERAAAAHRTPEYRAKKRREMIDYYKRNPQVAERTAKISKMTWDNCPEVKEAFALYRSNLDQSTRRIIAKGLNGEKMNDFERRVFGSSMKNFWKFHPQMRSVYQQRRIEVIEKLGKAGK